MFSYESLISGPHVEGPRRFQITDLHSGPYLNWSSEGVGFGQLSIYVDDDVIAIHNEGMSKSDVRQILHALADYIVEHGVLIDPPMQEGQNVAK